MNSKKKFVITISSLVAVIAIAVVTIVAVFAARNAGVNQTLTVRYTATDVSATVRANYIVGSTTTAMLTDDGVDNLVFRPTSETGGSLSPEADNIALDTKSHSIVFEYIFTNDSNSIDVAIDLDTTAFSTTNMNIGYAYSYSKIADTSNMPLTSSFEPMMILGEAKENGDFDTLYIYVKATVANLANDASFEGSMDFALTKATPVKLSFANVADATNSVLLQTRLIPANTNIDNLPIPTFADGKLYTWFSTDALETMVALPLNASADITIYAGLAPYSVAVSNGVTTIENLSNEAIYVSSDSGATFSFGSSYYTKSGNEYFVVNEGQKLNVSGGSTAAQVSWATPVSALPSNVNVFTDRPSDIETKLFYSAYGAYPQTFVGSSLNAMLSNAVLTATGKSYTTDINGTATTLVEYSYNGKLYAKLNGVSNYSGSGVKFSTGETVAKNQTYFFVVEPIVAKAYQKNSDGTFTMMTLEIMGSKAFNAYGDEEDNDEYDNSWQNSDLRAYLNSSFLNESGLSEVVVSQSITNTDHYGYSPASGNTTDNIWIASAEEILNWSGSGSSLDTLINDYYLSDSNDALRKRKPSDMALATYAYYYSSNDAGYYYLRSAGGGYDSVCYVSPVVSVATSGSYLNTGNGFCPAFAINL